MKFFTLATLIALVAAGGIQIGVDFTDDTAGELAGLVLTFTLDPS